MPPLLIARPSVRWRRVPLVVLGVVAQLAVGLIALAFRIVRVAVNVTASLAVHAEQQLAARTGRRALSDTGIAALAAAFITEFHTAYRATAR